METAYLFNEYFLSIIFRGDVLAPGISRTTFDVIYPLGVNVGGIENSLKNIDETKVLTGFLQVY